MKAHNESAAGRSVLRDLTYSRPSGEALSLDLYLPEAQSEQKGTILWIHGGDWRGFDWTRGSKATCPVASYASAGYAVASIDYRLAPRWTFPCQLVDCKAAVRWLRANAALYGFDGDRIAAWGFSGGALLANLVGSTAALPEFELGENLSQSSKVQAVVEANGEAYLYWGENTSRSAYWETSFFNPFRDAHLASAGIGDDRSLFLGHHPNRDSKRSLSASPALYVSESRTPTLLVTGTESRIFPFVQRTRFAKEMRKAKADITILYLNDVGHGGPDLYSHPLIEDFLSTRLGSNPSAPSTGAGRIHASGRGLPVRVYDRFADEENSIMMSSTTLEPWDNPVKGFSHPLVRQCRFFSETLGREVEYLLYLPSSYRNEPLRRYPVLYFMATRAQPIQEYALDFVELVHAGSSAGSCPEMIVALPNNGFFFTRNRVVGYFASSQSERMLANDFIPHIDKTYRTIATSEGRAMQGGCAGSADNLAFALRPSKPLFSLVSIAAPLYRKTLLHLFRKRRKTLGKAMAIELCYDENDSYGMSNESIRLIASIDKMGASIERFPPKFGGVHNWKEYLTESDGNGFKRFVERFSKFDARFACPSRVEDPYRKEANLVYCVRGDKELHLDLYLPKSAGSPSVPVVIWLHGTDWRGNLFNSGDKESCSLAYLAEFGYAVASVEYRLSGEEPYPAQVECIQAAVTWLRSNANEYGLDLTRLALCGDSAGGALASLATLAAPDNPKVELDGFKRDFRVSAVVCCGSPFDFSSLDAMHWRDVLNGGAVQASPSSGVSKFRGKRSPERVSPLSVAYADSPPHLLVHGSDDTVVSPRQSGLMRRTLRDLGVDCPLAIDNGGGHGFATLRQRAEPLIRAFLDARLQGETSRWVAQSNDLHPAVNVRGSASFTSFCDPIERENLDARYETLFCHALDSKLSYLVSVPPRYDVDTDRSYPLVFVFPEHGESPRDYLNYVEMRREAMLAGAASESILIVVNSAAGNCYGDPQRFEAFEKAFVDELIPHVIASWRVLADSSCHLIEGFGEGASAATCIALKHPSCFGAVSLVGPVAQGEHTAACILEDLLAGHRETLPHVRIQLVDIAAIEGSSQQVAVLQQHFSEIGMPVVVQRSDLRFEDRLLGFLEADFDVFAFHRHDANFKTPSIRSELQEFIQI